MSTTKEANRAWLNGANFSDNPYIFGSGKWILWAREWGCMEDERNDQIASDDAVTVWNRTVKD